MLKFKTSLLCGLALAGSLVATSAYAETDYHGLETQLAITGAIVDQHLGFGYAPDYEHSEYLWAGINGTISIGYRWGRVGLYVDQDLGGVWWTGEIKDGEEKPDPAFIGGTYLTLRGLIPARKHAEIDLGLGFGAMYGGGSREKGSCLVLDENLNRSAAAAFKFEIGLTYYFTANIGLGINLDYNLGLNIFEVSSSTCEMFGEYDCDRVNHLIHQINPGIHVVAQF